MELEKVLSSINKYSLFGMSIHAGWDLKSFKWQVEVREEKEKKKLGVKKEDKMQSREEKMQT